MNKSRLEAFSDGVLAIIITIMVLEMKAPHGHRGSDLIPLMPVFFSYLLSFVFIGIYWNNHHHLLQSVRQIQGSVLWANLHLLFWLSLVPFATTWMGKNSFSSWSVAFYGVILFFSALAYYILEKRLMVLEGRFSPLKLALGRDLKTKFSMVLYLVAVILSFISSWVACALYVSVALLWLIPDRRLEANILLPPSS